MGVTDAPTWLLSAFVRSCTAVGATAPREEIEAVGQRLIDRWQEPVRHFHDLRHVVDVLARVDELAEETHRPDVVRLAAWYHGAVFSSAAQKAYARSGGEDEVASADLARDELSALGVPEKITERVHRLIRNLRRHDADTGDVDCLALCDADLATLAVEPQRYQDYRRAVREEYAHIPQRDYLQARIAIVGRLLARRNLFLSPMGSQWEEAARENLTAELDRLHAALAKLPEDEVSAAGEDPMAAASDAERTAAAAAPEAEPQAEPQAAPGGPSEPASTVSAAPPTTDEGPGPSDRKRERRPARSAEVDREPEHRPSSLESVPEELAARQQPRTMEHANADRARRAERARIAERGRLRVEQAMRERHRGGPEAAAPAPPTSEPVGTRPDAAGGTPRSAPSSDEARGSDVSESSGTSLERIGSVPPRGGTGATAASPSEVAEPESEVAEREIEVAEPESQVAEPETAARQHESGGDADRPQEGADDAHASAATPADVPVHSMERDPDLLGPVRRRRKAPGRRRRSTDGGDGSTSTGPLLRGPKDG